MQRLLLIALTAAAFGVGYWHLRLVMLSIFLFREGEPMTSWIFILCGPGSTLPAALLSCFRRKAAGYWLIAGALISLVAALFQEGGREAFLRLLLKMAGPMLAIGVGMLLLSAGEIGRPFQLKLGLSGKPLRLAATIGAVSVSPVALYLGVMVGSYLRRNVPIIPLGDGVGHSVVVVFILVLGFLGGDALARTARWLINMMRRQGSEK